jgi:hypothetical protein
MSRAVAPRLTVSSYYYARCGLQGAVLLVGNNDNDLLMQRSIR